MASKLASPSKVVSRCPYCHGKVYRSVKLVEDEEGINLLCTICEKTYDVPDTKEQRKAMQSNPSKPFCQENLTDFAQLGVGDVFGYKSRFVGIAFHHSSLCYEVNRKDRTVRIIELMHYNFDIRIVKRELNFDEIMKGKNHIVFRFMPLDCLPLGETLQLARRFAAAQSDREEAQEANDTEKLKQIEKEIWPPRYDAYDNNCQHFTSYCKTGVKQSVDGDHYKDRDPGCFLKGTIQMSKKVSGWSAEVSEKVVEAMKSNKKPTAATSGEWSSSKIASGVWSKRYIKGLVSEWGPTSDDWSSKKIPLAFAQMPL